MSISRPKYRSIDPLKFCRPATSTPEERHTMIALAAYSRAERRGFQPGHELEDWLAAQAQVDEWLHTPTWADYAI